MQSYRVIMILLAVSRETKLDSHGTPMGAFGSLKGVGEKCFDSWICKWRALASKDLIIDEPGWAGIGLRGFGNGVMSFPYAIHVFKMSKNSYLSS